MDALITFVLPRNELDPMSFDATAISAKITQCKNLSCILGLNFAKSQQTSKLYGS